jgi:hypothetical protein
VVVQLKGGDPFIFGRVAAKRSNTCKKPEHRGAGQRHHRRTGRAQLTLGVPLITANTRAHSVLFVTGHANRATAAGWRQIAATARDAKLAGDLHGHQRRGWIQQGTC